VVTAFCRPDFAARRPCAVTQRLGVVTQRLGVGTQRLGVVMLLGLLGCTVSACGTDETLDVPPKSSATATFSAEPESPPGTLDVCAAFAAFMSEPAATEALCVAMGASDGAGSPEQAETQCRQCALAANVVLVLSPAPSCPKRFEDCSASEADLERCAHEAGAGLAKTNARCASMGNRPLGRDDVLATLTTRSCTQVILNCPAAIDALSNVLGVFGGSDPGKSR
jgi:hypothetical protein